MKFQFLLLPLLLVAAALHAAETKVKAPELEKEKAVGSSKTSSESGRGTKEFRTFEAFSVPDQKLDEAFDAKLAEEMQILTRIIQATKDQNSKADRMFRLAELYWLRDRARYFRGMERFDRQFDAFVKGKAKKPVRPQFTADTSFKIMNQIIQSAPRYERMDEVLFRTGLLGLETRNENVAFPYFEKLVQKYPRSPYRLDAYMEIGNYQFNNRKLDQAVAAYKVVLRQPSPLYNFALYKLAWCQYNLGKIRPAMTIMQRVVSASKGVKSEIELREEGLKDLVLFYSDLGLIDEAQSYFVSIGEPEYGFKVLEKLANIYFDQARYSKAIITLKKLLAAAPFAEDAPKYHSKLIESYEKSQQLPQAMSEMGNFVVLYDKGSPWHNRIGNAEAREYAYERSEVYARFAAKKYHEQSQSAAKTDVNESERLSRLAASSYQKYLERFSDHQNAYEMGYLYGELLFRNKEHAQAAEQFERVAKSKARGKYHKLALVGQIDALSRLEEDSFKELEKRGLKKQDVYDPIQLSPHAKKLIEADVAFVKAYPKDPKVADTLLHRAQLYYNYNQFDPALKGFFVVVERFPTSSASNTARNLILDIYNIRKDWESLEKWAATFLRDKTFATPENRSYLLKLIQGSIFQRAKDLEDKKEHVRAAQAYLKLTEQYPDSEFAEKALFNAAIAYMNADASDKAMNLSRLFLRKYPNSDLTPKMMLALASYFDDKLDFEHAAEYYEVLAVKAPKAPFSADALFNAGLYRENLGHYARALGNYQTYLEKYPQAKDAEEIFFSRGLIYEKLGNWREAASTFLAFPKKYGSNPKSKGRVVESWYRYGNAMEKLRGNTESRRGYQNAVALFRRYNKDPSLGASVGSKYAAKAAFELVEPELEEYKAIRLTMPQDRLAKAIDQKARLLRQLQNRYLEIVTYGDPEMGVAALYHVGLVYQKFGQALFNAPVPKQLNPQEVQLYQQELQNRAAPIEQKAVEAYEKAVKKAFELEVYNEWTDKSYQELTQYKPSEYPLTRGYTEMVSHRSEPLAPFEVGVEEAAK